jgi:hypothetical protein
MGQPVTLYAPDGQEVTVYGPAQRAGLEAQGYTATPPAPPAAKPAAAPVEDKPKPTAAKKTERKP